MLPDTWYVHNNHVIFFLIDTNLHLLGFNIVFYVANLSNESIYTTPLLAMIEFPRSVKDLPEFINMKTISQLS